MRSIKFRAWNKVDKHWLGWDDIALINNYLTSKHHELVQFTGFTDAGHEDLYEGDIFEDEGEWFHIEWSDEDGAWWAMAINGGVHMQLSEFAGSSTCWKQGNIYENPKLLDTPQQKEDET